MHITNSVSKNLFQRISNYVSKPYILQNNSALLNHIFDDSFVYPTDLKNMFVLIKYQLIDMFYAHNLRIYYFPSKIQKRIITFSILN